MTATSLISKLGALIARRRDSAQSTYVTTIAALARGKSKLTEADLAAVLEAAGKDITELKTDLELYVSKLDCEAKLEREAELRETDARAAKELERVELANRRRIAELHREIELAQEKRVAIGRERDIVERARAELARIEPELRKRCFPDAAERLMTAIRRENDARMHLDRVQQEFAAAQTTLDGLRDGTLEPADRALDRGAVRSRQEDVVRQLTQAAAEAEQNHAQAASELADARKAGAL